MTTPTTPLDALKKYMSADSYISAQEALNVGIVDHIITSPNVLYKNIQL